MCWWRKTIKFDGLRDGQIIDRFFRRVPAAYFQTFPVEEAPLNAPLFSTIVQVSQCDAC